ncbi:MAG: tetratricopeptide repeat protein [Bacteroidota bacterium]
MKNIQLLNLSSFSPFFASLRLCVTFLVSMLFLPCYAQQITLNGQTSLHNSKYEQGKIQYIDDAYVSAAFATPTSTDATGKFNLIFQNITKGDRVELTVEKDAYEVVNERDLLDVVLGRTAPIKVYLAPQGQLAQAQTELYDISVAALTKKHDALIAELRKGGEASEAIIEQLKQQIDEEIANRFEAEEILNQRLEETKKRLPETVKQLANVNLDFASQEYRTAYKYYKAGEVEQALKVLDEAELTNKATTALASLEDMEKDKASYQLALEREQERIDQIVQSYTLKAEAYNLIFDYRAAVKVYQKAVTLMEETKVEEDLELAEGYEELGLFCKDAGIYEEALSYQIKSLDIKKKVLGESNLKIGYAYQLIANLYDALGKYPTALDYQTLAIKILERTAPEDIETKMGFYTSLSNIHRNLRNYQESIHYGEQVLNFLGEQKSYSPSFLIAAHTNLCMSYISDGQYEKAVQYGRKAVIFLEEKLDPTHPEQQVVYNNLMIAYQKAEAFEEAVKIGEQAISNLTKVLEPNHPHLAHLHNNLGTAYGRLVQYEKAVESFHRALQILDAVFSSYHVYVPITYSNLGEVYIARKEFDKAETAIKKAITLLEQYDEDNVHERMATYIMLSMVYYEKGDADKALTSIKNVESWIGAEEKADLSLIGSYYMAMTRIHQLKKEAYATIEFGKKTEFIFDQLFPFAHRQKGELYLLLFNAYKALGNYEKAQVYAQMNLDIRLQLKGNNHPSVALAYRHLCDAYNNTKQFEQAEKMGKKSVEIFAVTIDSLHPERAIAHHTLAFSLVSQHKFEEAIKNQEKAVNINRLYLSDTDSNMQIFLQQLAAFKSAKEEYAKFKREKDSISEVSIQGLVEEQDTAQIDHYNKLVLAYKVEGNYENALAVMQKIIGLQEQALTPNHIDLATSYNSLATIYQGLGAYQKALTAQQKTLAIQQQLLVPTHPSIGTSYNNLAVIYSALKDYDQALTMIQKSLNILEQAVEPDSFKIARSYNNLALAYKEIGDYENALAAQQKDIGIMKKILPPGHPDFGTSYHSLASIYVDLKAYEKALSSQQQALLILENSLPTNHQYTLMARRGLEAIEQIIEENLQKKLVEEGLKERMDEFSFIHKNDCHEIDLNKYGELIQLHPDSPAFYYKRGLCFYCLGHLQIAEVDLDRGIQRDSLLRSSILIYKGLIKSKQGEYEAAQKLFNQVKPTSENDYFLSFAWSVHYLLQKNTTLGLSNLEKAIQLDFTDLEKIQNEEAFQILHDEPRYQAILQQLKDKN